MGSFFLTQGKILTLCFLFLLFGCEAPQDAESYFRNNDYQAALEIWRDAARNGDPEALQKLGMMYYLGLGVKQDFSRAIKFYGRAARAGNAQAQWNLGSMYASGVGVETDFILAYGWFYHAEQNGHARAQDYMQLLGGKLTPNQIMKAKQIVNEELKDGTGH